MKTFAVIALAMASSATAQAPPLSFDAGKALPLAAGQWSYAQSATGSEARYGMFFSMRCDRAARIVAVERIGGAPAVLTIATSSLTRSIPVGGRIVAGDPLLDAIAFSRGRFLVAGGIGPVLAVPSWPEAARSIEDCRN